ncbi:MAG: zf-HC2 domain-containing protein [Phycisphaerae bacterium]
MCCEQIERQLGRYVDKELSAVEQDEVEAHIEFCSSCQAELEALRELTGGIAKPTAVRVPGSLWATVERRLGQAERTGSFTPPVRYLRIRRAPWAIAAGVVLAVGLAIFRLPSLDTAARASTVDFGVLLDALPLDAQKAFRKFLVRYDAKPTTPVAAKRTASELNFGTPATLPGGFRLRAVYELRIGGRTGIAAAYNRGGEFLGVVFHPPMKHENFGSHENYPCVIGEHCGHKVQVGAWKLVHLTDPTTCHCLLTRLNEHTEIPAVMKAVAPGLSAGGNGHGH